MINSLILKLFNILREIFSITMNDSSLAKFIKRKQYSHFEKVYQAYLDEIKGIKNELEELHNEYINYNQYLLLKDERKINEIKKKYRDLIEKRKVKSILNSDLRYEVPYRKIAELTLDINKFIDHFEGYNLTYKAKEPKLYPDVFKISNKKLTREQRDAIVTDDKFNQIIAGAGSGKTLVLVRKIKYLLAKGVSENRILAITYTNEAAKEMKRRVKDRNKKSGVNIRTIHSFGNRIINSTSRAGTDFFPENKAKQKIKEIVMDMISQSGKSNSFRYDFFNYYDFTAKGEVYKSLYKNITDGDLKYQTKDGGSVRSLGEKEIYHFFIDNNVSFEYEKEVEWSDWPTYNPDFYLSDHDIYLEHWGLDENFQVPEYWSISSRDYKKQIQKKREQFKKYNKKLIETWYYWYKAGVLSEKLGEILKRNNVALDPVSGKEYRKIIHKYKSEFDKVIDKIYQFISICKKNNYNSIDDIMNKIPGEDFFENLPGNLDPDSEVFDRGRYLFFYRSAFKVYKEYKKYMEINNLIDYDDMIKNATKAISKSNFNDRLDYIFIDEFQDVEKSTVDFINSILEVNPWAKLFVVGDDWQSIYGFNGSSPKFFKNFKDYFGEQSRVCLTKNFRCPPRIVEASSSLIKNNEDQIDKEISASFENKIKPVIYLLGHNYYLFNQASKIVEIIKKIKENGGKEEDILIISRNLKSGGRFRQGIQLLIKDLLENKIKYNTNHDRKKKGVRIFSIHATKGLESKYVIIMDVNEGYNAEGYDYLANLPSQMNIEDELTPLKPDYNVIEEERRLLYVAVTRAIDELYIFVNSSYESRFINEIRDNCMIK